MKSSFPALDIPTLSTYNFVFRSKPVNPLKAALICPVTSTTITYSQLHEYIITLSSVFATLGLRKGDVIAIYSPNHIYYPVVLFAACRIGCSVTTVNPGYTATELKKQLNGTKSKLLICHSSVAAKAKDAMNQIKLAQSSLLSMDGNIKSVLSLISTYQGKLVKEYIYTKSEIENSAAILCYSAGTTGSSKGVITTHRNLVSNVLQLLPFEPKSTDDVVHLAVLPFYHIFALSLHLHSVLYSNETLVVVEKYDLKSFLELIPRYKVTHMALVPPIILQMAKQAPPSFELRTVRTIVCGAAPLGKDLSKQFFTRFGLAIQQAYGMSETSPLVFYTPRGLAVPGSCGILGADITVRIVNADGKDVASGDEGELLIKGPNVMKGYLNNDIETAIALKNRWLSTGDIAKMQVHHGKEYFFIVDRIKELIKFKGLQVIPSELEALLLTHPRILDAAIVPRKDEATGEKAVAYVVLQEGATLTEDEVKAFVEASVSYHKWLHGGVRFVSEIPKSAAGKILRRVLRGIESNRDVKAKL